MIFMQEMNKTHKLQYRLVGIFDDALIVVKQVLWPG